MQNDDVEREYSGHQNCDEQEEFMDEIEDTSERETEEFSTSLQSPFDSRPGTSHEINREKSLTAKSSFFKNKRRAKKDEQTNEILAPVGERLRANNNDDQLTIFGNNFAAELRTLSRETRLYTEKLMIYCFKQKWTMSQKQQKLFR